MSVVDVTTITNRGDLMPDNIPKCGILAALKKNNFKDFNCRTLTRACTDLHCIRHRIFTRQIHRHTVLHNQTLSLQ